MVRIVFNKWKFIIKKIANLLQKTTTGASRYSNVLKDIGPRIVIVEEAAEVFEAHIVSAISKNCEHLILIGDHVQLRPNPVKTILILEKKKSQNNNKYFVSKAVYKLAKTFNLDVSLFERLINNQTKKVMLTCQHRMRPEISVLMKHFYELPIEDHISIKSFLRIIGLGKDIFFLNHSYPEANSEDSQSKQNFFEANYISELCAYLLKQKYEESQITILSMYLAQMIRY